MTVKDITNAIEQLAPLCLQEEYDNSGLQVGYEDREIKSLLVSLDITEEVIEEAHRNGCQMVVSHHPLIFKALHCVSDKTYQQRCVALALKYDICLYSAHTNLDNAPLGVCSKMAEKLALQNCTGVAPLLGSLPEEMPVDEFLKMVKQAFGVNTVKHNLTSRSRIGKVALCGGAGAFLMDKAREEGAHCFITGEFRYHDYFESEDMLLVELGHYESEKYTEELLCDYLGKCFPELGVLRTAIVTNPIIQA